MELHQSGNQIRVDEDSVPFFEALASKVRIKILQLLAQNGEMNLKEIAEQLSLSSAIISMHVNKLENSGLVVSKIVKRDGRNQRICTISDIDRLLIFPKHQYAHKLHYDIELGVGHYTNLNISPTCGIVTAEKTIGDFDNPVYFMDPQRIDAQLLWFSKGFVEYTVPNYVGEEFRINEISISLELSSEAPGFAEEWPSDISFFFGGQQLCTWTSPGEFGGRRGNISPSWWFPDIIGQYGLLKTIRINDTGTYIDGVQSSDVSLAHLDLTSSSWNLRVAVLESAENVGGVMLFGKGFGDFAQNILVSVYYSPVEKQSDFETLYPVRKTFPPYGPSNI